MRAGDQVPLEFDNEDDTPNLFDHATRAARRFREACRRAGVQPSEAAVLEAQLDGWQRWLFLTGHMSESRFRESGVEYAACWTDAFLLPRGLPRRDDPTAGVELTARIPPEVHAQLTLAASERGESVGSVIARAVAQLDNVSLDQKGAVGRDALEELAHEEESTRASTESVQRDADESAADVDLIKYVREAIELLPETQAACIVLREVEGLSYAEIAQVMDCPVGTVMSRLYHGRQKIYRHVDQALGRPNPFQFGLSAELSAILESRRARSSTK